MATHRRTRRIVPTLAAATLSLGLVAGTSAATATAAAQLPEGRSTFQLVDGDLDFWPFDGLLEGWSPGPLPFSSEGRSGEPGIRPGTGLDTESTTESTTGDASDEQSSGLVLVSTDIEYGSGTGAGTGMVLTADGYVVTNHHVVQGATGIEVTVAETGETYDATYVGGDATSDVAVLRLEGADDLTPIDTDTSGVQVGDEVVSVGDAGGDGGTLTAAPGEVSQTSTEITVTAEDGTNTRLTDLIEVTSDIIAGDSGGALLDEDGEVVGMNVAASSGGTDIDGYVIPMARVVDTAEAIMSGVETSDIAYGTSGFLGVSLAGTPDGTADGSATIAGVLADGPADEAGLTPGDTITAVDGQPVTGITHLQELIGALDGGDTATVAWTDAYGDAHEAQVTLADAPVA